MRFAHLVIAWHKIEKKHIKLKGRSDGRIMDFAKVLMVFLVLKTKLCWSFSSTAWHNCILIIYQPKKTKLMYKKYIKIFVVNLTKSYWEGNVLVCTSHGIRVLLIQ